MFKQFFKISFYAFITFCVVNFSLLLLQIYFNIHVKEIPKINIGFPWSFYSILWQDIDNLLHGAEFWNFIYDIFFYWIIVFLYFTFKNYKQQTINNNNE